MADNDAVLKDLHAGGFTELASNVPGLQPQKVGASAMSAAPPKPATPACSTPQAPRGGRAVPPQLLRALY